MNSYRFLHQLPDPDVGEVQEWVDSHDGLTEVRGHARARRVLLQVLGRAEELGIDVPAPGVTDYINTIPAGEEPPYPGDEDLERRIRHYIRRNAAVMVARANRRVDGLGGHLALRVRRHFVRGGLQPFLPRQGRRRLRVIRCSSRATPPQASSTPRRHAAPLTP